MLFGSDEDNTKTFLVTDFDFERLKCLVVGSRVDGENGSWSCLLYPDEYVLIIKYPKQDMKNFKSWRELVQYLK